MTPDLLDLVRNLYAASGGAVPGPAWTALVATAFWMAAYDDAPETGDQVFEDAFAARLGWNDAQREVFWNDPSHDFGPDGAPRFDDSYDAWERMLHTRRSR